MDLECSINSKFETPLTILALQISRYDSAKPARVLLPRSESRLLNAALPPSILPSCQILNMSSNVGLTTPRGSGTSGYVQRNLSHLKPRDNFAPYPKDYDLLKHRQRKPDKEILDHDRLREVEVKVFDLRDKLEDEGYVFKICFCTYHRFGVVISLL